MVVSAGSASASLLSCPDGSLLVRLLNTTTNAPLAWVGLQIYQDSCEGHTNCGPDAFGRCGDGVAGEDGMARLDGSGGYDRGKRYLEVSTHRNERLLFLQDIPYFPSPGAAAKSAPRGVLLSDRGVYRGGGQLFLHGYLRQVREDGRLALPFGIGRAQVVVSGETRAGVFSPAVSLPGGRLSLPLSEQHREEQMLDVVYEAGHGGFSLRTTVPLTARAGEHQLTLRVRLSDDAASAARTFVDGGIDTILDTLVVHVADPRPPSVSMTAAVAPGAMRVMPPGGKLRLAVQTSTLSGVPVGGARVTMRWCIQPKAEAAGCAYCLAEARSDGGDGGMEGGMEGGETGAELPLLGEEELSIGADGTLHTDWAPPVNASRPLTLGDSLHLTFEWVGPTREMVTAGLDVPVALSERTLSIVPPSQAEFPHIRFWAGLGLSLT
jgi:hypothetical protein